MNTDRNNQSGVIHSFGKRHLFCFLCFALFGATNVIGVELNSRSPTYQANAGDSIVFIGNTFVERMRMFGHFELFLHSRFPEHPLKIRNMGWSADEVALRPRPRGFGDMHRYLTQEKADTVFACFGMNEAFRGVEGLAEFSSGLEALILDLQKHRYNGRSAPQIILISPIAHENLGGHMPDGQVHNVNLEIYTQAMLEIAGKYKLAFVDLYTPTRELMVFSKGPDFTINGIHLNNYGYWRVSQIMARSLGLIGDIDLNYAAGDSATEKLRRTIYDKNYSFFFQWHPPNMEYLHGRRNRLPGAEGMPEETAQLNDIVGQLDRRIWRMEKPQPGKVWGKYPMDIQLSASTPDYTGIRIPEIGEVVRRGGDEEEGRGDVLTPDEALKRFHLPEGYAINVFASEENSPIANPVAMHFDVEGRLWVANSPTWPHPLPGSKPNDSIIILEDTDHDGVVDKQSVFINGLDMIHGFILGDGGAYISQTPNIIHIKDTNGDGRADTVRTVLHGFGGEDVEHSINNYRWGPDGALYFMEGIFFHTQVETPYGPRRVRDAGVFRYKPLTERFDVFVSYAFWNPWGQVFDRWGQSIVLDASSHDYFNMDILSANFVYPKKKHNEHDKLSFAPDDTGPGAGIEIVSSGHFPDDVQGRFLAGELSGGFRGIRWYEMSDAETSYELKRLNPEFLISDDPFFRPLALSFGPDGALYVADFYSALIENTSQPKRRFGRDHIHGRIYRITYPERKLLMPPKITGQSISELLDLLKIHENATRQLAQRELQGRGTEQVIIHLKNWMNKLDSAHPEYERHLLESLWIYQRHEVVEPKLLIRLLDAKDFRVRASATRVLRFWQDRMDHSIELLEKMVEDDHARVRLQAVLACGFNSSDRAVSVALRATRHPMDAGLRNALDDTMDYFDRIKAGK